MIGGTDQSRAVGSDLCHLAGIVAKLPAVGAELVIATLALAVLR